MASTSKPKIPERKGFAFWRYDLFPYLLGGRVTEITKDKDDGVPLVHTAEYGSMLCKARWFLPAKQGDLLQRQLDNLRRERSEAREALDRTYNKKLDALLKHYGIKRNNVMKG